MSEKQYFDEMRNADGSVRDPYRILGEWLDGQPRNTLQQLSRDAETIFRRLGITFAVYGANESTERLIPFDVIPRVIAAQEWRRLEKGIEQRVKALNMFLWDLYHGQASSVPDAFLKS